MHEKTFAAINKLKDIELELHRLKNALEMANKALDAQRPWVGLTDEDCDEVERWVEFKEEGSDRIQTSKLIRYIEAKIKEKNNAT